MSRGEAVYGVVGDHELVFIPYDTARELVMLRRGFATWGDAREAVAPVRWLDIIERVEDENSRMPDDADPYDPEMIRGHGDGEWPEWPSQLMLAWMPASVLDRFGRVIDTTHSGKYVELDPAAESQIVAAMEAEDWTCVRDNALVLRRSRDDDHGGGIRRGVPPVNGTDLF